MKQILLILFCFAVFANAHSQGITLLYTGQGEGGWIDPTSWTQVNVPSGQTPIQRVPTELDSVVFSSSLSGLSAININFNALDSIVIGGTNTTTPYRCKSMHVSNTDLSLSAPNPAVLLLNVYTSSGGYVLIDSGSNFRFGLFQLYGGNPGINDMDIENSTFGSLFSHNSWSTIQLSANAKARFEGSTLGGQTLGFGGGTLYANNCTFNASTFTLGDNSSDSILNSIIQNDEDDVSMVFHIGRNANFVSSNLNITCEAILDFYTSGSVLNGNVSILFDDTNDLNFTQEDPKNPLPNIINGDLVMGGSSMTGISGDVKISGNLINNAVYQEIYPDSSQVYINGQDIFAIGGITNYGSTDSITDCVDYYCHYKLEFFGSTNSIIQWPVGLPIDTLVIGKSGCAKVTPVNSLYVSGAAMIDSGQLVLNPNEPIPFKFVCAGNLTISQGGGLFMRRDASSAVANIAVGGIITDNNVTADSGCAGLSNPYHGNIDLYNANIIPVTLLDFNGKYQDRGATLNWSTVSALNASYFTLEKAIVPGVFKPLADIAANHSSAANQSYHYVDASFLNGTSYYRLKMVDVDGGYTYSNTISVSALAGHLMSIFPNPVKDELYISLQDAVAAATTLRIVDTKGTSVKALSLNAGITEASINTSVLPAGVYSIIFDSGKSKETLQFIKQ
jgi:hypothetical protein